MIDFIIKAVNRYRMSPYILVSFHYHMKKEIVYYGIIVALVVLLVKGAEYNLFAKHISTEVYSSILILVFTGLGLWFGLRFTTPKVIVETQVVDHLDPIQLEGHGISKREFEILERISQGLTNQQIADQLFISLSTVKSHLQNTYQKLGVKNRTQAIQKAKALSVSSSTKV